MAIYVFQMKTFSRTAGHRGSRSTSAAAYRSGERIRDQRTGATYDHRGRQDVLHKEIMLPEALDRSGAGMGWARSRATLWNAVEHAETRRNSRVAREFMVALPHELPAGDRITLARGFARELVERYGIAVDLVVHAPRTDERNFHAHLLATTREVTSEGLGRKAALELSGTERHRRGLMRWAEERAWLRERWATHANQALHAANLDMRISHEYSAMRHSSRMPRLPLMAYHIERRGGHSVVAERLREQHRATLARAQAQSQSHGYEQPSAASESGRTRWLERVRERAREAWLAMRQRGAAQPTPPEHGANAAPRPTASATHALHAEHPLPEAQPAAAEQRREPSVYSSYSSIDELQQASAERWLAYRQLRETQPELAERLRQEPATHQREQSHDYDLSL